MGRSIDKKLTILVIGGGIAGSTAADRLNRAGMQVHVVEKKAGIGGRVREMGCKATDVCQHCSVCVADEIFRNVIKTPEINVHTSSELISLTPGTNGNRYAAVLGSRRGPKTIEVDSVLVATGYEPFNPSENPSYGYGNIPNVITGVEAEKQLATDHHRITRTSDGKTPKRIAFVQCVGSRTEEIHQRAEDTDYCSTVCCSYALRMGRKMVEESVDSEVTFFYMDIQKFGKGFDEFYSECGNKMRFVRSRPYELKALPGDTVQLKYASESSTDEDEERNVCVDVFDLVVLAVGIRPTSGAWDLATKLEIPVDEHGFFGLKTVSGTSDYQKPGIFAIGACEAPRDIAGCIGHAEAVVARLLDEAGGSLGPSSKQKPASREVVVAGGGVSGMQASSALARLGYKVSLLHSGVELGGVVAAMPELYAHLADDIEDPQEATKDFIAALAGELAQHKNISIHTGAVLERVAGEQGNFAVRACCGGKALDLRAGAVVLATGSTCRPVAAAWDSPHIVDMAGLRKRIRNGTVGDRVAMILDLAAEQGRGVWAHVLSAAAALSGRRGIQVKIYCSNVRVAATGMEALYRRAREAGVAVIKLREKPRVALEEPGIVISYRDPIIGTDMSEEFDMAVMADLKPCASDLANAVQHLRAGLSCELQYDNVWLEPGLTNRPGIFVVGEARGNSDYRLALTDGLAVAAEVHEMLAGDGLTPRDDVAKVDEEKCVLCLTCMRICPHGAITIDYEAEAARPSPVSCRRCGICAAECPAQAITLPEYTDEDITPHLRGKGKVLAFACENSAIPAAEDSAQTDAVTLIKVPCAGDVDPRMVLNALENGAEKVWILGCHPESCRFLSGSIRAVKRAERLMARLEKAGVGKKRVRFGGIASVQSGKFEEYVKQS